MLLLSSPQNLGRLTFAATLLCVVVYFYLSGFSEVILSRYTTSPQVCTDCADGFDGQNVVVVVKTGATEAAERVRVQTATSLKWAPNILYFSDLEQDLDEIHIYDALDVVSPDVQRGNSDFVFYHQQQTVWQTKHNLTSLKSAKHPDKTDELAAWSLDKYKNVHILEKTWAMLPDKDWYIFIDADTYLIGPTTLAWLATLDPQKKTYLGSMVMLGELPFAHGGSGYIVSGASMREYAVTQAGTAARWEGKIQDVCCGDFIVGQALEEQGSHLQDVWPLISGETPFSMPFGVEYWCNPQFTMHHMDPASMELFAAFESNRTDNRILTPSEIFQSFIYKLLPERLDNWDNLAWDKGEYGHDGGDEIDVATFDQCAVACANDDKCLMYHHNGEKCYTAVAIRHGKARPMEDGRTFISGWNHTRINEWIKKKGPCTSPKFPSQKFG